jgi:hypothetical protein
MNNKLNQGKEANQSLEVKFEALVRGDIGNWEGLPNITTKDLESFLGEANEIQKTILGAYPALLYKFSHKLSGRNLNVYERYEKIIMVEVIPVPDSDLISILPKPDVILSQEIFIEGAYAHEYLYCKHGLMLTVAQDLISQEPNKVVRCRTIQSIKQPQDLNSELYFPLDAREKW